MNISNYYWYFSGVLTPKFCDDVIAYANSQEEVMARTGGYGDKKLNKHKVISKKSYSDNRITIAFDVVDEKTIKKSYKKYGEVDTNTSFIPIY